MTRDEYDAHRLPEATVEMHRDPAARETYVVVKWLANERPHPAGGTVGQTVGFRFRASEEMFAPPALPPHPVDAIDTRALRGRMTAHATDPIPDPFGDRRTALLDLITLVVRPRETPSLDVVCSWSADGAAEVERWAAAEHLHASDNDTPRLPVPDAMRAYLDVEAWPVVEASGDGPAGAPCVECDRVGPLRFVDFHVADAPFTSTRTTISVRLAYTFDRADVDAALAMRDDLTRLARGSGFVHLTDAEAVRDDG